MISLAHNLGLKVVAEGVEDIHQMEHLHGLECDFAEGISVWQTNASRRVAGIDSRATPSADWLSDGEQIIALEIGGHLTTHSYRLTTSIIP